MDPIRKWETRWKKEVTAGKLIEKVRIASCNRAFTLRKLLLLSPHSVARPRTSHSPTSVLTFIPEIAFARIHRIRLVRPSRPHLNHLSGPHGLPPLTGLSSDSPTSIRGLFAVA